MTHKFKFLIICFLVLLISLPLLIKQDVSNTTYLLQEGDIFNDQGGTLPVYQKNNLLGRYIARLENFYGLKGDKFIKGGNKILETLTKHWKGNKSDTPIFSADADITASDLMFADDNEDTADYSLITNNNINNNRNESVNLQNGTVLTSDNLLLKPTQEGYYYKETFFKNGTYPRFASRRTIEGALNRYHTLAAGQTGKKALYLRDNAGNLTVNYVDNLPNTTSGFKHTQTGASNTFLASNNRFRGAKIIGKHSNPFANRDVKAANLISTSLNDIHSAYDLLQAQIRDGSLTSGINIHIAESQNKSSDSFFGKSKQPEIEITDTPNNYTQPSIPSSQSNQVLTVVLGNRHFSEDYAMGIHDLGCATGDIFTKMEVEENHITEQMENDPKIDIELGTCKPPLDITPSADIDYHMTLNPKIDNMKNTIKNLASNTDKTIIKIVSTDRNIAPMLNKINEEHNIKNKQGEIIEVFAVGPQEGVSDLSQTLESVTSAVIAEKENVDELNSTLAQYYRTTQLKPTNNIVAYEAGDGQVFAITDPNNSYWIKSPKSFDQYPKQYLNINGVSYEGVFVHKDDITNIVKNERTNFLLVSNDDSERLLPNGSVMITLPEEELNLNSFEPTEIERNIERIKDITKKGDKEKSKYAKLQNKASSLLTKDKQPTTNYDPEKKSLSISSLIPSWFK